MIYKAEADASPERRAAFEAINLAERLREAANEANIRYEQAQAAYDASQLIADATEVISSRDCLLTLQQRLDVAVVERKRAMRRFSSALMGAWRMIA